MTATIGVIGFETTDLFPGRHDRVIEVAIVGMRLDGHVEMELASLVNPRRDVGPTSIHGLTAHDVVHAPALGETAGLLVECLDGGAAIAAHNVLFNRDFLAHELSLFGRALSECHELCTLRMGGRRTLTDPCQERGFALEKAHDALDDARATALLLARLLEGRPEERRGSRSRAAAADRTNGQEPGHVRGIDAAAEASADVPAAPAPPADERGEEVASDRAALAYAALLTPRSRIAISTTRVQRLVGTTTRWGQPVAQIESVHREYVARLVPAAIADGVVCEAEHRDLMLASETAVARGQR